MLRGSRSNPDASFTTSLAFLRLTQHPVFVAIFMFAALWISVRNSASLAKLGDTEPNYHGHPQIYMIAIADKFFQHKYSTLFEAMKNYASQYGYQWRIIGEPGSEPYCENKYNVYFFRKHCIVSNWMKKETKFGDRVFVFDADVVPYRTHVSLNHWLEFEEDLIFYDRTWNTEVAAGNYMAKNTNASRHFLLRWAD